MAKKDDNKWGLIRNEMLTMTREALLRLSNTQTDVDTACKYPLSLSVSDYRAMYNRMGLARRVVEIWPDECWQNFPEVYESEEPDLTDFEKTWNELMTRLSLYTWLHRLDVLSGIGSYGTLLLGLDDGASLQQPVAGINEKTGEMAEGSAKERKLLFLRAFDESVVTIDTLEDDISSPRFGMPKMYSFQYQEPSNKSNKLSSAKVHWTRIIHAADNRESSETYGISRLQAVYNNLLDIKKVSGGSGEMFWKGGFPGYVFELSPEAMQVGNVELDTRSIKEQMQLWSAGLQRWLALEYVTTKSLSPQVSDPTGHVEIHLKLIALSLGVPYRILMGSEEAKLASVQDKRTWNSRVAKRQNSYLSPLVIRPLIDRLIAVGVLPMPKEKEYVVEWPDLNAATDDDIAKVALNRTEAFAKYVQGNVDVLISPRAYLTTVHKMTESEAETIVSDSEKREIDMNPEPEIVPAPEPAPIPRVTKPQKTSS